MSSTWLGDSSYMILRPSMCQGQKLTKLYRSREQQHYFDCPFQCGTHGDSPTKAFIETHQVQNNDIIVMGTDGIWDNWFDYEIEQIGSLWLI